MSGIFSFLLFDLQKGEYISGIDEKLLTAARMAKSMLPEDYHDRIRDEDSVSRDDFVKIVESFDRICVDLGLQYLWSNMVLDGRIVFTTATSTSKRPGSGDHAGFLDDHRDPAAFAPVIASGRTTFSTFHNEWGDGRMVLVPDRDALGRLHVFGASIGIAELDAKLRERAVSAALVFLSMLGLGTLVSLIAAGRVTRSIRRLTETAQAIASGGWGRQVRIEEGGAELRSLATSVNTMSEAVRRHTENLRDLVAERTAEIVAQKERAEAALRVKSDFLANMSHEIRTPLNAVIGFAQLLERDRDLTPAQKESAAAIARGGEHLLDLIDDVLEMSKAEAGRGALRPTTFALPAFLDDLRAMMAPRAAAHGLDLSFEPDAALPALIVADQGKLRQVLINLLGNAIKFTDEGGVALRARGDGDGLVIEVEDSGKGIAAQDLDTIFQPFEQTEVGVATGGGTGLGLAI
ncbi:MAG: HAMP domain-containing protein, partial [Alphaproteobacteria bacterium]|nr:HAMP domain-containing protein [Alphaproteobacteria bacterium]